MKGSSIGGTVTSTHDASVEATDSRMEHAIEEGDRGEPGPKSRQSRMCTNFFADLRGFQFQSRPWNFAGARISGLKPCRSVRTCSRLLKGQSAAECRGPCQC